MDNYQIVYRKDRSTTIWGGEVITYRRVGFDYISDLGSSDSAERIYSIIHSDMGPLLLVNWYRPPGDGMNTISSLEAEYHEKSLGTIATIMVGDLNIHHKKWLKFSNRNSTEGEAMQSFSQGHNLLQWVLQATRGQYLLDVCLSDLEDLSIKYDLSVRTSGGMNMFFPQRNG